MAVACFALSGGWTPLAAQETGSIQGTVVEEGTLAPLVSAQVFVPAQGIGTLTDHSGRFRLEGVGVGTVTVRVRFLGYASTTQTVAVAPGAVATLDFQLRAQTIPLNEVVVTGTGAPTERKRLGQTIIAITGSSLETAPITSVVDALQGRIPGLGAGWGLGETGQAARILLRGTVSLTQRNEPLIYIDGFRMDNTRADVGGVASDRLSEINPADIERIEVIKGAAAATLFGTEASSGVIQIFTKRGTQGGPSYTLQMHQQVIEMDTDRFPYNYGYDPATGRIVRDRPADKWVELGHHQNYDLSIQGGSPRVRYYVSGRAMSEDGPLPNNDLTNASIRSAFDVSHSDRLQSSLDVTVLRSELEAPRPPWSSVVSEFVLANPAVASPTRPHGEQDFTVAGSLKDRDTQTTTNFLVGATLGYDFSEALRARIKVGHNEVSQRRGRFRPEGEVLGLPGLREIGNRRSHATTLDGNITWEAGFGARVTSTLVLGGQSFREGTLTEFSSVQNFASPTLGTLRGGATITGLDEVREDVINAGIFGQAQLGLDERLFVTAGLRMDGNSAFGKDFGFETYPKLGFSWVVSEHGFWNVPGVQDLRIRAAVGTAGVQPGAFDHQRTWEPFTFAGGLPAITPLNLGNPGLKPERSTEREVAIEAGMLDGRLGLEAVFYQQTTSDALVPRSPAPSSGFVQPQLTNIGELRSKGVELSANARLIDRTNFRWDFTTAYTGIDQVVEDMGGVPPFRIEGRRRWSWIREGYRAGAVIAPVQDPTNPYTVLVPYESLTKLSEIQPNLVKAQDGTDSLVFMGNSLPRWTVDFGSRFRLGRNITLQMMFSGAGGFIMSNETELIRTAVGYNYNVARWRQVLSDPASSAEDRRRVAEEYGRKHPSVVSSFMENGTYLKWTEFSLTYEVPDAWAARLGLGRTSVSFGGRNLMLFTRYSGIVDPGTSGGGFTGVSEFLQNIDYLSAPVPHRFVFTLRTTW